MNDDHLVDLSMHRRLERIETKLDQLGEALTLLARVEERLSAQHDGLGRMHERMDALYKDVDAHAEQIANLMASRSVAVWVAGVGGAVLAAVFSRMLM